MFDVAPTELLLVAAVAVIVIGPKDLPKAMRVAGYWVGKARGVARQFRQGFDDMVREAEYAEMEKKWADDNARIMREFPADGPAAAALPAPKAPVDAGVMTTEQPALVDDPADQAVLPVAETPAKAKPRVRRKTSSAGEPA